MDLASPLENTNRTWCLLVLFSLLSSWSLAITVGKIILGRMVPLSHHYPDFHLPVFGSDSLYCWWLMPHCPGTEAITISIKRQNHQIGLILARFPLEVGLSSTYHYSTEASVREPVTAYSLPTVPCSSSFQYVQIIFLGKCCYPHFTRKILGQPGDEGHLEGCGKGKSDPKTSVPIF